MFCSLVRYHLSILLTSWTSSTLISPEYIRLAIAKTRLGVGDVSAISFISFSRPLGKKPGSKPSLPSLTMRIAFCIASSKLRPMDITSPTAFMLEPSRLDTCSNLTVSQRGNLTTQ